MNREILFRGKRLDNDEWLYGDLMHDNQGGCYIYPIDAENLYVENKVDPDTVGQFTGLLDKYGKRVFEGDIVRYWREDSRRINPDCDPFNWIYESFIKKIEIAVSYEDGMFVCEDYTPLVWCGIDNLEELRNSLGVTEEDDWGDADGNTIDEFVLGIEVIDNIHDTK